MPPLPTESELQILQVLWNNGPLTVRQVLERMPAEKAVGYTTVLKLLQIMTAKGLVRRDDRQRTHIYRPVQTEAGAQRKLVRNLLEKAFGGSPSKLLQQALSGRPTSREELEEIRQLINEIERRRKS